MNAEQLLTHFERIADAPDAIPRLRRFILDLAVRGKLVAQDPNDEPASELLKRIAATKGRSRCRIESESEPYGLPTPWKWAALDELITTGPQNGISPKPTTRTDAPKAITLTATTSGTFKPDNFKHVEANIPDESEFWLRDGDLIFQRGNTREYVGIAAIYEGPSKTFLFPDLIMKVRISSLISLRFVHLAAVSPPARAYFSDNASGAQATMPKINQTTLVSLPIPLPPFAEQHRIVAKVDELMALCDRLETARKERETTRNRLAAASLARLNAPDPDPVVFQGHAAFALNNLTPLTTRPDQIKALRQTILNLAVRGKLVEQDPNDESAAELLKRIAAEKTRMVEAGEIGEPKSLLPLFESDLSFDPPSDWKWIRLGTLVLDSESGWSPQTENHAREGNAWGILKVSAVSWSHFDPTANKQVLPGTEPRLQAQVHKGDFLISRANTAELVARAVLVQDEPRNLMMSDKIVRLRLSALCDHNYVLLVNNISDFARSYYTANATGTSPSMKNVSRKVILDLPFPLPPLAEQHRIVAKVDELMVLCDRLEASLATGDETRGRLVEALLHETLATGRLAI